MRKLVERWIQIEGPIRSAKDPIISVAETRKKMLLTALPNFLSIADGGEKKGFMGIAAQAHVSCFCCGFACGITKWDLTATTL